MGPLSSFDAEPGADAPALPPVIASACCPSLRAVLLVTILVGGEGGGLASRGLIFCGVEACAGAEGVAVTGLGADGTGPAVVFAVAVSLRPAGVPP